MLRFEELMGDDSGAMAEAMAAGREFLVTTPVDRLLALVGQPVEQVPAAHWPDKRWFQRSFGRSVTAEPDDLMVGQGLFYLTEQRRLFLDCTAGHYQMTWGYDYPPLRELLLEGMARGVVWDNHSNIPAAPVKRLAERLVEILNPGADMSRLHEQHDRLNTVLLGLATGSVACSAALKVMLAHYAQAKGRVGAPVLVTLAGNYHGTDMFAQRLRGMWPQYFANVEIAMVEPNAGEELEGAFRRYGERVAGFWAEPVMMNREAIVVEADYLRLAERLCREAGALVALDEIQTGFWYPEMFWTRRYGLNPDFVILGKGMTAGFHPLSGVVYRGRLDTLEQYDAISTNGNAALAAYVGLGCMALIEGERERIAAVGREYHQGLRGLAAEFPEILQEARGEGHMSALKFRRVEDALGFHRCAVERGLWLRAHAYHAGHSTVLSKFALSLTPEVVDFAVGAMRRLLEERPWR